MSTPATVTKVHLSGGTRGRPISVVATTTPGTLIHTATATANMFDELWLYVSNTSVLDRILTLELGNTGATQEMTVAIPAKTTLQVLPGHIMSGGDITRAYADSANILNVFGYVHRIDQS